MANGGAQRVAVVGAGGVGGWFGALLAKAGRDVSFLARGEHLRAMREHGLRVKTPTGDWTVPVAAFERAEEIGPCSLVLFAVKAYDVDAAAASLPPLLAADGKVVTLQNGVDSPARVAAVVGPERVLAGVAYVSATRTAPGCIEQAGGPSRIVIGELGRKAGAEARAVQAFLSSAGIACEISDAIEVALWSKFVYLSSLAGVCAVERLPVGEVISSASTRALVVDAIREAIAVAHARGVALPSGLLEKSLEIAASFPHETKPSLLVDLVAGRRIEIDALSGAVIRLGAEVGVQTPFHREIFECLEPWDAAARRASTTAATVGSLEAPTRRENMG
jgi:2-dehydropantoate 2-reductase